jgi:hypothetical protein
MTSLISAHGALSRTMQGEDMLQTGGGNVAAAGAWLERHAFIERVWRR